MKIKMIVRSPLFSISGYGNYAREIVKILHASNKFDLRLEPVFGWGENTTLTTEESSFFNNLGGLQPFNEDEISEVNYLMIHLPTQYPIQENKYFFKYKKRINLTMFETDNIMDEWAVMLNKYCDILIVPTEFNVETFSKKVHNPIIACLPFTKSEFVVNLQDKIDMPKAQNKTQQDYWRLYHNCDFGTRKGPLEVVRGYLEAFKNYCDSENGLGKILGAENRIIKDSMRDFCQNQALKIRSCEEENRPFKTKLDCIVPKTPQLILKWYNNHHPDERIKFKNFVDEQRKITGNYSSEIYLIHESLLPSQLDAIYNSVDCYIQPAKGEGLNLPAVESILHKKPVILSRWSSHLSLLDANEDLNWIEGEVKLVECKPDPFYGIQAHEEGHNWFYPNLKDTINKIQSHFLINGSDAQNEIIERNYNYLTNWSKHSKCIERFVNILN